MLPWKRVRLEIKPAESVQYFVENYAGRQQEWAVCYRDKSIPDTPAHAEAFHNLLKPVYSDKRNRHLRTMLEKLIRIEEDFFIKYQGVKEWILKQN
jgi:hypothetical protein